MSCMAGSTAASACAAAACSSRRPAAASARAGYLYPGDGGFVYLGASSVTGEPAHVYSGNGASAGAPSTPDDQIGILTSINAHHARLEMPYPQQESTFDVIELKR